MTEERLPPQSLEMEQCVLGSMLCERHAVVFTLGTLAAEDFYRETHRTIFLCIKALYDAGKPIDLRLTGQWLKDNGQLEKCGGTLYLDTLMANTPTAANIRYYAECVRQKAVQRAYLHAASALLDAAYAPATTLNDLARQGDIIGTDLGRRARQQATVVSPNWTDAAIRAFDAICARAEAPEAPPSLVQTNIPDLQFKIAPSLKPGKLIILAGYTGMGKTSFALANIALPTALAGGKTVYYSLEMSEEEMVQRALTVLSDNTPLWSLLHDTYLRRNWTTMQDNARISQLVWQGRTPLAIATDLAETIDRTNGMPLAFPTFYQGVTPMQILADARLRRAELGGLDLVVVDGLWLMGCDGATNGTPIRQRVSDTVMRMKGISRELGVNFLLTHQLSRPRDKEADLPHPTLPMLIESGAIEQSADLVLFVHRPEDQRGHNGAYVCVAKQRNGEANFDIDAGWQPEYQRFVPVYRRNEEE
jgi:replicative DNA helicase